MAGTPLQPDGAEAQGKGALGFLPPRRPPCQGAGHAAQGTAAAPAGRARHRAWERSALAHE
eukprot:10646204-Lingulodinium_polyedra.AAC.1